jgi:hypothetical protein
MTPAGFGAVESAACAQAAAASAMTAATAINRPSFMADTLPARAG